MLGKQGVDTGIGEYRTRIYELGNARFIVKVDSISAALADNVIVFRREIDCFAFVNKDTVIGLRRFNLKSREIIRFNDLPGRKYPDSYIGYGIQLSPAHDSLQTSACCIVC